jgi:hypothetical protein
MRLVSRAKRNSRSVTLSWRTSYGREFAVWIEHLNGICFTDSDPLIWISGRLHGMEFVSTGIHEWLHSELPSWSEKKVRTYEERLAGFLWPIFDVREPDLDDVLLAIYRRMPSSIPDDMKADLARGLHVFLSNMRRLGCGEFTHVAANGRSFKVCMRRTRSLCKYENSLIWICDRASGKVRLSLFLREWMRAEMAEWSMDDAYRNAKVLCDVMWCHCKNRNAKYLDISGSIDRALHWLPRDIRMELKFGLHDFLKKVGYA